MSSFDRNTNFTAGQGCAVAAVAGAVVVGLIFGISALTAFDSTDAGHVAVVRNGGPFAGHNIRQTMGTGQGATWVGIWTDTHKYPAQQRFYTITSDPKRGDRAGVDIVSVPSSDGVMMGLEGTFYFTLNTDPKVLKDFDNKYGTRTYTGQDGKTKSAYDGDEGWNDFLDQIARPVFDNDLRQVIGQFHCDELVSSCALVQNGNQTANATGGVPTGNVNIAKVQDAVNQSMKTDLNATLGGEYLTNIHFALNKVTLPPNVQDAVDKAQAAYAAVSESQAKVAQAMADAKANETRQQGYNACPTCAQIDELKALPSGVTVFAPGAGTGLPLTGAAK